MSNAQELRDARTLATHEEVVGIVRAIVWHDAESGATIAQLDDGSTVKGEADDGGLDIGTSYRFFGRWRDHSRYGRQFCFDSVVMDAPCTRAGMVKYLATTCRGIGQVKAELCWKLYGPRAIEMIRTEPHGVADDLRMDFAVIHQAAADLDRDSRFLATRLDLMSLFSGRGFSKHTIAACIARWGVDAARFVRRDPFVMLVNDIPGAGFKRCDQLFLDLGGNPARLKRQMIAGWDAVRQDTKGNTWHMYGLFFEKVAKSVGNGYARTEAALELAKRAGWLVERESEGGLAYIAESQKSQNEADLACHVRRLRASSPDPWPAVSTPQVSAHQAEQFANVKDSALSLLIGGPGTGKTFVAAAVLKELAARNGKECIAVCAPTGKAAVRISEAMLKSGLRIEAKTIHRLLGIGRNGHDGKGWEFAHNEGNPLPFRVVVCDESSMLDTDLAASLLRAIPPGGKILLVGDTHQLPPVGHGCPLRDIIAAKTPCASLVEIQRNSGMIVRSCHAIKDGRAMETAKRINLETGDNLQLVECEDAEAQIMSLARLVDGLQRGGRRDPVWDLQVLCPTNDSGKVGRKMLNTFLQGLLNPLVGSKEEHQIGEFRANDKIICLKNCELDAYEMISGAARTDARGYRQAKGRDWKTLAHFVANGDLGKVVALDVEKKAVFVTFACPDRTVRIPLGKGEGASDGTQSAGASDFALAYAITGHKSQGSEWPIVAVMVDPAGGMVSSREWIYTAISRAKEACIMFGRRRDVERQCAVVTLSKRKTFLKELLCAKSK